MNDRSDRFVLITGTSRGIGRATALRLASAGISVIAGVRNPEDAARLESEAQGRLFGIILDVGRDESIDNAARVIREMVGDRCLFGLVNNAAGAGRGGPMEYVTREDLEAAFSVTAFGTVLTTRALLPLLKAAGGRVVNVGAGRLALPLLGAGYGAKFALEGMTDVLRVELRRAGVRVSPSDALGQAAQGALPLRLAAEGRRLAGPVCKRPDARCDRRLDPRPVGDVPGVPRDTIAPRRSE